MMINFSTNELHTCCMCDCVAIIDFTYLLFISVMNDCNWLRAVSLCPEDDVIS